MLFARFTPLIGYNLADGDVITQRLPIDGGYQRVGQRLAFFREKPVDEQLRGVGVRRAGERGNAAAGTAGAK